MSDRNKTFAFLMCAHKLDAFLPLAIDSVLKQTYIDFKFYIIANNCDDDLWSYLSGLKDHRIEIYRTKIGQLAFNLNYGINLISADYVIRFDSDDICLPDRLSNTANALKKFKYPDVLSGSAQWIDVNGCVLKEQAVSMESDEIKKRLWWSNPVCHPATAISLNTLVSHGGYSWGFGSEDYDLWLRLARSTKTRFVIVPEIYIQYRISGNQSKGGILPYSESVGLMFRELIFTKKIRFFLGGLLWIIKALLKGKR